MWSEENTEALKNKIAELKNKSLKKQNMENSSETNMEFTHAQRWAKIQQTNIAITKI